MKTRDLSFLALGIFLAYIYLRHSIVCNVPPNLITKLVRQAARWSTAAAQDEAPLIAVLHANYGSGYLWALKDIASAREIENATGIYLKKFEDEITRIKERPKHAPILPHRQLT